MLSPVDTAAFLASCSPVQAPTVCGPGAVRSLLRVPQQLGKAPGAAGAPGVTGAAGWQRVGPTRHALGWVYSAALMRDLLCAWDAQDLPLNPLDVWVWEVMASRGHLPHVLAPVEPLVIARPCPAAG